MSEKIGGFHLRPRPRMDFASLQRAARNCRMLAPLGGPMDVPSEAEERGLFFD